MCGIVGFLEKCESHKNAALGRILMDMLQALACRGPDSAGVALFGTCQDDQFMVRVKLGDCAEAGSKVPQLVDLLESLGVKESQLSTEASYARFVVGDRIDLAALSPRSRGSANRSRW
jgi:glucosamine 6-phosphate synthetase-like amidotransferase/phosphosugar isomerase protein